MYLLLLHAIDARRVRIRPRPIQREEPEEIQESIEEDNRPQSAVQYYNAESSENIPQQQQDRRLVLVSTDDDYNGYYGQPTARPRADYNRPTAAPLVARGTSPTPKTKDQATRAPPVQTIRNYSKVNDDGSFTFGYEAADGSFKEETRGTDCVVRGKYGYIDPDGNKREFTYVSGNPCDPNNPSGRDSDEDRDESEEDSREPENVPQNYPKRPIQPVRTVRPIHTTTSAPTTVFQTSYSHPSLQAESEEEEPEPIQVLQPQRTRNPTPVQAIPQYRPPQEVTIRQRPRITVNTTPTPLTAYQSIQPVSITPRPTYRAPIQTLSQTQPPPTTYRPSIKVPQQPAAVSYSKSPSRPTVFEHSTPNTIHSTTRRPIDFAAEFQKFQKEHNIPITTTTTRTTASYKPFKPSLPIASDVPVTSNPIYESQLIFDPNSGQYDSALYQQLPQTDGDFQLSHKIQPYVHQISSPAPQLVSLEQLAQVNPLYRRPQNPSPAPAQFSQQVYEKERENLQVFNSQQLFQQQQELQQQQLQQDRIEAARKAAQQHQHQQHQQNQQQQQSQRHRFQASPQSQGFYYIQPPSGQFDTFIRGHNFDF